MRHVLRFKLIPSILLVIILSIQKTHGQDNNGQLTPVYIIAISWSNVIEGTLTSYWLMEKTLNFADTTFTIKMDNETYKISPMIDMRYEGELIMCCEKENINYVNADYGQKMIDSLSKNYKSLYEKNFNYKGFDLQNKRALDFKFNRGDMDFKTSVYKLYLDLCKCRSADNHKASSLTDTAITIKNVISYLTFTKKEKKTFREHYHSLFENELISDALPLRAIE